MSSDSVFATLRQLIERICDLPAGTVQPQGRLLGYQMDSVRALDLMVALEDFYGLEFDKDAWMDVKTVSDLQRIVEKALEDKP